MSDLTDLLIKLIPVFPLLTVIANGLFGSRYSQEMAHRLAWGSVALSFLCVVGVFADVRRTGVPHEVIAYQWIFGGDLTINLAYLVDPLTCVWLLVVTGVGFLIHGRAWRPGDQPNQYQWGINFKMSLEREVLRGHTGID